LFKVGLHERDGGQIEISPAYRHVSIKILEEFPNAMCKVASPMSRKREKFRISLESRVDDPLATIQAFNRQFMLGKMEQEAVAWGRERGGNRDGGSGRAFVEAQPHIIPANKLI
jgi:hypothetical protein